MTEIRVGAVDVYVVDPSSSDFRVLLLRRAHGTRCTGAWEGVHGRIEFGELPEQAALRELGEETGLKATRLYNVGCQPFYVHRVPEVMMAVVFAAVVPSGSGFTLSAEHDLGGWQPLEVALARVAWPRSRAALRDIREMLAGGDAGPLEDVMRLPTDRGMG